jgi:prolyl-tRNA synthetase
MKERAEEHVRTHIRASKTMAEVADAVEEGVTLVSWCGSRECADLIEEKTRAEVLGTDVRSPYLVDAGDSCVVCGKPGTTALVGRSY